MANPYESSVPTDPFREHEDASQVNASPYAPPQFNAALPAGYGTETPPPLFGSTQPLDMETPNQFYAGPGGDGSDPAGQQQQQQQVQAETTVASTSKFWKLEFYQRYFDVTTRQVLLRLSNTLVPMNPPDFLLDRNWHYIDSAQSQQPEGVLQEGGITLSRAPDLYGPFWVCTTLWITLGVVGNIMSRIAFSRDTKRDPNTKWKYDFTIISVASLVMYLYCFVFGAAVWGIMYWKKLPASLLDTVCLYGYSMFIFLLVAILCMIPVSALQWVFVLVGGLWSTGYLLANFWRMWKASLEPKWFIGIVAFVSVFHMLLALSFKFYFVHYKI